MPHAAPRATDMGPSVTQPSPSSIIAAERQPPVQQAAWPRYQASSPWRVMLSASLAGHAARSAACAVRQPIAGRSAPGYGAKNAFGNRRCIDDWDHQKERKQRHTAVWL